MKARLISALVLFCAVICKGGGDPSFVPIIKPPLGMDDAAQAAAKGDALGCLSVALHWAQTTGKGRRQMSAFRDTERNTLILRAQKAREYLRKADAAGHGLAALVVALAEESRLSYSVTKEEIMAKNAALAEQIDRLGAENKRENEQLTGDKRMLPRRRALGVGNAGDKQTWAMSDRLSYNVAVRQRGGASERWYYMTLTDMDSAALSYSSDEDVGRVRAAFARAVKLGAEGAEAAQTGFEARVKRARAARQKAAAADAQAEAAEQFLKKMLD